MQNNPHKKIDGIRIKRRTSRTSEKDNPTLSKFFSHDHEPLKHQHRTEHDSGSLRQKHTQISHRSHTKQRKIGRSVLRWLTPVVLGIVAVVLFLQQQPSAQVYIEPRKELSSLDTTVEALLNSDANTLSFGVIALSDNVAVEIEADSEELVETYAQGRVRIFNDYSTAPQRLLPETRFESVDGKLFFSGEEEILIPGREGDVPGEVSTRIYAEEPGSEYNIEPTDFSLPGFLELGLDERYAQIYALSTESFQGGSREMKPSLSPERIQQHSQELEQKLGDQLKEQLIQQKTPEMILIQNSATIVFTEPRFSSRSSGGGELILEGTIYALLVSRDELAQYLGESTLNLNGNRVYFSDDSNPILVYQGDTIDYENINRATLTVKDQVQYIWDINSEPIKEALRGFSVDKLKDIAQEFQEIGKITVKNHPRWSKTLPYDLEDINLHIN